MKCSECFYAWEDKSLDYLACMALPPTATVVINGADGKPQTFTATPRVHPDRKTCIYFKSKGTKNDSRKKKEEKKR